MKADPIRNLVIATGERAYRAWLADLEAQAKEQAEGNSDGELSAYKQFGLTDPQAARAATLKWAVPLRHPNRRMSAPTRESIEQDLRQPATTWLVPVVIAGKIASIVVVETRQQGAQAEAIEFGQPFLAARLQAATQHLATQDVTLESQTTAQLLTFRSPTIELLVLPAQGSGSTLEAGMLRGGAHWIQLKGTPMTPVGVSAKHLNLAEVDQLLATLTPPRSFNPTPSRPDLANECRFHLIAASQRPSTTE